MKIEAGQVFYSKQKDSEWLIWHEITAIDGDMITLSNYGKETDSHEVNFTKKEIRYCIRKGMLIPA